MIIQTHTNDRKALAKAISEQLLNAPIKYMGTPTYAYQIGTCVTIGRQGAIEIQGADALAILKPFLMEQGWLSEAPAIENMEITIPVRLTVRQLTNLVRLLYTKQVLLNHSILGGRLRISEAVVTRLDECAPDSPDDLSALLINFKALGELEGFGYENGDVTLVFPVGEHYELYAGLLKRIIAAAKSANRVSAEIQEPENERYLMRAWLIRLGYGGADLKAERRLLLRNLRGQSAFPNESAAEKHRAKYAEIRRIAREVNDDGE